jgi:Haem-degrading
MGEMQMTVFRHLHRVDAATVGLLFAVPLRVAGNHAILTLDLAKKMAAWLRSKAKQEGRKMNIAVVNDGANLVYFEHLDGSLLASIDIAQHEAMTSGNFPRPDPGR